MVDPFGEISFLTRSENRVEVLTTLADAPHTERELVDATGISDVTVGRILEDFAERGWIRDTDAGYAATPVGDILAEDYARLRESMDVAAHLGPVLEHLPVESMDFDLRVLADARISDPGSIDPFRAIDRWKQLVRESDRVVGLAPEPHATTVTAAPFHEAVVNGDLEFGAVVSQAYYEAAHEHPEMPELLREVIGAGGKLYLADGEDFSASIALFDDIATVTSYDDEGTMRVGIESRADPVREWVHKTYEACRESARPLTPEDFAV